MSQEQQFASGGFSTPKEENLNHIKSVDDFEIFSQDENRSVSSGFFDPLDYTNDEIKRQVTQKIQDNNKNQVSYQSQIKALENKLAEIMMIHLANDAEKQEEKNKVSELEARIENLEQELEDEKTINENLKESEDKLLSKIQILERQITNFKENEKLLIDKWRGKCKEVEEMEKAEEQFKNQIFKSQNRVHKLELILSDNNIPHANNASGNPSSQNQSPYNHHYAFPNEQFKNQSNKQLPEEQLINEKIQQELDAIDAQTFFDILYSKIIKESFQEIAGNGKLVPNNEEVAGIIGSQTLKHNNQKNKNWNPNKTNMKLMKQMQLTLKSFEKNLGDKGIGLNFYLKLKE